jgi:hypothetical protein
MDDMSWTGEVLDGASHALLRRLAALAYAGEELHALLLGTLGPGSRHYLQRVGALSSQPDGRGRWRLTDRGVELCKRAAVRVVDEDLDGRVEEARIALAEAIARAERMEQESSTNLRF